MSPDSVARELPRRALRIAASSGYPDPGILRESAEAAIRSLSSDTPELRPPASSKAPGGLVRVSTPYVLLIPDLHARSGLLADLLRSPAPIPSQAPILDLVIGGELTLICLGDILHTEGRLGAGRWTRAAKRLTEAGGPGGILSGEMDTEMGASLWALLLVMMLKSELGGGFHCLKGNHDNLGNREGGGDLPFHKYALEGAMGAEWFRLRYGEELMGTVRVYERLLPVAAAGHGFCASHAEPGFALGPADLLEYGSRDDVVRALIWTGNGEAESGAVERSLSAILGSGEAARKAFWLSGHRPVPGAYAWRAAGRLLQIHNPERRQVAWLDNRPGTGSRSVEIYEVSEGGGKLRLLAAAVPPPS